MIIARGHSGLQRASRGMTIWLRSPSQRIPMTSTQRVPNLNGAWSNGNRSMILFSTSSTDEQGSLTRGVAEEISINLSGFKSELGRAIYRSFKKSGKAKEKLSKAKTDLSIDVNKEDVDQAELELIAKGFSEALAELRDIEAQVKPIKNNKDPKLAALYKVASEKYGVCDKAPPKPERGAKKVKGPRLQGPRRPYFTFKSVDELEIRVGRQSADNDELSCSAEHRDGPDWWLHVSGSAGSHVIIRCHDDDLETKYPGTVRDAALLAIVNSKAPQKGKVAVNLTRARQVSKPIGAKPGLVRLNGEISLVPMDANAPASKERLQRLLPTKDFDRT